METCETKGAIMYSITRLKKTNNVHDGGRAVLDDLLTPTGYLQAGNRIKALHGRTGKPEDRNGVVHITRPAVGRWCCDVAVCAASYGSGLTDLYAHSEQYGHNSFFALDLEEGYR